MALALLLLAMAANFLVRTRLLRDQRGDLLGCGECFTLPALTADAWIAAAVLALIAVGLLFRARWWRGLFALAAFLAMLPAWVDVGTFSTLSHRLLWADALRFGGEGGAIVDVVAPWLRSGRGLAVLGSLIGFVVALAVLLRHAFAVSARVRALVAGAALLVAGLAWSHATPRYIDVWFYTNVYAFNDLMGARRLHSPAEEARIHALAPPAPVCQPYADAPRSPAVILLVIESWSMHHSQLFSGLNDLTPGLDALAQEGSWFPDFVANSFSTETALIALLNGVAPLPTHRARGVVAFDDVDGDFHRWLRARGYWNGFFTPGDLGFGERREWLPKIGITNAEGADHPAYAGWPRGAFDAPADRALFARWLQWFDGERPPTPFLATLLTVGTHPPFKDVDDSDPFAPGEAAGMRRIDRDIRAFVAQLRTRGFFDAGILVVLGDHRTMTPIGSTEIARFGDQSAVRVPMFVLGASGLPPGRVPGPFQQSDFIPSLRAVISGQDCRNEGQGRWLGPAPVPAKHVVYQHPGRRDEVRVLIDAREYRLRLDGDDTRWIGALPPDAARLRDQLLRQRLSRDDWPLP